MPVPEMILKPVREEMTRMGLQELRTPDEVDRAIKEPGTLMIAINSMCGCAASRMRPAVARALKHSKKPEKLTTIFAGQDLDATSRARQHFVGYPPSSPSVALLKDGEVIWMLERRHIEGRMPDDIARDLVEAFDRFC